MKSKGLVLILLPLVSLLPADGQDQTKVNIPQIVVGHLRSSAAVTFLIWGHPEEYAAAVTPYDVEYHHDFGADGGRFSTPTHTTLLLHTHPMGVPIQPSPKDVATAVKFRIPNCVVSQSEIWCAMPDGRIEKMQ
jgi:hypothetical protein